MADTLSPVIEESDLAGIVQFEISNSITYNDSYLSEKRRLALEYMAGKTPDLDVAPGMSRQVSRDVSDTVGWMLPGILEIFAGSANMVEYAPEREADEEGARQATDYINYLFFRESNGYLILRNASYDSLVLGNGIARCYWEDARTETKTMRRVDPVQIAILMEDEDVEILGARPNDEPDPITEDDPETGLPVEVPVPTFTVKIRHTTKRGKICAETCKPENLMLNDSATVLEEARAVIYLHDDKTRADLIEMGFDYDMVWGLPALTNSLDNEVNDARFGERLTNSQSPVKSQDRIDLYEGYIRADIDGDGLSELVQVWYAGGAAGGKVLDWSEWEDDIPFTDIPCYPVPHRWDADGVPDRTMDIARVKTTILRQALNNLYAANLPMREIETGSVVNPDIIVHPKFGGTIWKKPGSAPIVPHSVPFVADKAFVALEYMDRVRAQRTGVSETSMALDPDALQNQTARANQNAHDASYSQTVLVARDMAELGWVKFFSKFLKLVIKYQDRPKTIRLRGKWVEMDPRTWNANMSATINVGLGTGSRERDMAMLNNIQGSQIAIADRLAAAGMNEKAMEFVPKVIATAVKIAESAGLKDPESYYPQITEEQMADMARKMAEKAQQPSPEEMQVQAEMQLQQQLDAMQLEADKQTEMLKAEAAAFKERAQAEADVLVEGERRKSEQIQAEAENSIKLAEINSRERIAAADRNSREKIELMKLGAVEIENDAGMPEIVSEGTADRRNSDKLADVVAMLVESMNMDEVIVRDDVTGRAIGKRKVRNSGVTA